MNEPAGGIAVAKPVLAMTPKRKVDLWKRDDSNPTRPIVIMGYNNWVTLNAVGAMVWERCTAERTVAQIVDEIMAQFVETPREQVEKEVVEFLRELDHKALLVLDYDPLGF